MAVAYHVKPGAYQSARVSCCRPTFTNQWGGLVDHDDFEDEERAFMEARDRVSDEELIARMNASPDMGGAMLIELSEFVRARKLPLNKDEA